MADKIEVNGIKFNSVKEAAHHFGLSYKVVHARLKRGESIEVAFSKIEPISKPITVNGKKFPTTKAAAEFYGVKYSTVRHRIRRGWSHEQAMGLEPPPINTHPVSFRGRTYKSIAEISREFGVDQKLVRDRLAKGYDVEQALGLEDLEYKTKPLPCVVRGRQFASRNEAAKHFGVNKGNVAHRVNKLGWTLEQALELEPRPGYEKGVFGCVYLISNKRSDKAYVGTTRQRLEARFLQHVDRALTTESHPEGSLGEAIRKQDGKDFEISMLATGHSQAELQDLERQFIKEMKTLKPEGYNLQAGGGGLDAPGRQISVNGKSFESVAAAARHFGVNPLTACERLRNGYSAEFFGQPIRRVRKRINTLGWSVEDALKKGSSR